ncbi:hypothetical protein P0136_12065 [Lentisphaerota bacterium ZTH]|nr:hypothetical protein JYG24_10420 [Lentisphaerota bacterium]WET06093.1 hypothetical protein P0136_12065 [Lentisphaerota bacterium ZTH]
MAVKETGVSYYGISYVEHARKDFAEMVAHNCNAVLIALTEFDIFFWKPQIPKIVDAAKKAGLKVYLNTWGIGKFFGGEAPSLFLQECSIKDRQFTALTGEPLAAASPSSPAFREYVWEIIDELARTCNADGFFWDEPHYAMPVYPVSYQSTADFSCRSEITQRVFKDKYNYEMPKTLTRQVRKFRHDQANELLIECSRIAKARNPDLTITQCSLPADNNYYLSQQRGFDDWELIASRDDIDTFATSIIVDYTAPLEAHRKIAAQTVALAQKYGKVPQRWVMSYFDSPAELNFIKDIVNIYSREGIESIFSWTYRAGEGTFLSAPEPQKVWDILGQAFGEVLSS